MAPTSPLMLSGHINALSIVTSDLFVGLSKNCFGSCLLLRHFIMSSWLEKWIEIGEAIAYNVIVCLNFDHGRTWSDKNLYLNDYLVFFCNSFSVSDPLKIQHFSKWLHKNWLCFDKDTLDLVTMALN